MGDHKKKTGFITWNIWTIFLFIILVLSIACMGGIAWVRQNYHSFQDFIVGEVAYTGTNKSGEWILFWALLVSGCVLAVILACVEKRHEYGKESGKENGRRKWLFLALLCFLPMLTHLVIYGRTTDIMIMLTAMMAGIVLIYREKSLYMAALYLCLYFAVESAAVLAALVFHVYVLGDYGVLLASACIFIILSCLLHRFPGDKKKFYERLLAVLQIPVPALLLIYLKDQYAYEGYTFQVNFPRRYVVIVCCLTAIMAACQLIKAAGVFRGKTTSGKRIWFPTVFSTFAFISYMPPAMLVQSDLHHHGEQILPWQQIVMLGQKAYEEYSPASGLFPMLTGAVNSLVFHGRAVEYGISYVLVALLFESIIIYLLYRRLGGEWTFFAAVVFHMPVYCRTWILLPVLLILSEGRLIKKRVRWLLCWVFLCFLSGLYYPLFGAALLLGTFPFGAIQLIEFIRNREWKESRWPEWLSGGGLLLMIGLLTPLLYRMAKHVLSLAGQSIDADGMAVIGNEPPGWFMPYLSHWKGYEQLYYILRILLGSLFVIMAIYLLVRYLKGNKERRKLLNGQFLLLGSIPAVLCICYTYTMVCMDEDWVGNLLSRSGHVILFVCGLAGLVVLFEVGKELLGRKNQALLIAMAFSIPFLLFYECGDYGFPFLEGETDGESYVIGEYSAKLQPYEINGSYVMITDEIKEQYPHVDFDRIGDGFIELETLQHLDKYAFIYEYLRQYDEQIEMLGFEQSQFYYFLLNEKAVYSGRTAIAKSRKASEAVIAAIDPEHTVVRQGISTLEQYYLYRFFVQAGYVYSEELGIYMPGSLYRKIYGCDGSLAGSPWAQLSDCGLVADAFGKSLDSMETCEKTQEDIENDISIQVPDENTAAVRIETSRPVDGGKADFLYIRLKNVQGGKMTVSFNGPDGEGGEAVSCDCGDGSLLIPVGTNPLWLLSSHTRIDIRIEGCKRVQDITVEEVSYYHLK